MRIIFATSAQPGCEALKVHIAAGKEYTVMDNIYSSGSHPSTGEEREFLIDENNPEHFFDPERMKSGSISRYIVPAILFALGIYLIVAG